MQTIAIVTILVPFIGALVTACSPYERAKKFCILFALLTSLSALLLGICLLSSDQRDMLPMPAYDLITVGSTVIFGVIVDKVSTLICFAVVFLGLLVSVYSTAYLSKSNKEHPHEGTVRYYALLLVFIGAMAGLVLSSTILGQLFFFEITGGCSWALIGYYQTPKSQRSAMKALIVTHIGAIGLYIGAAWLFSTTGTFSLSALASPEMSETTKIIVIGGIMFAAWSKSAQIPMHMWLPDAMEAPTPVSAYLHAASMVKVGVYIFARAIMEAQNVPHVLGVIAAVMAVVTLLYGFMMYLPQVDMKRLLAYSTITQLSYIFFALSLAIFCDYGSDLWKLALLFGGVAYIFNHAFAKSLFFLVAGALSYTTGTRILVQLKGLLKKLPLLGFGFGIAALAITGVPPFNGFFSKFAIFAAGFELAPQHIILLLLLILVLIESVASFAWFIYWFGKVVPGKPSEAVVQAQPLPVAMKIVLIVLMVMSVLSSVIAVSWLS